MIGRLPSKWAGPARLTTAALLLGLAGCSTTSPEIALADISVPQSWATVTAEADATQPLTSDWTQDLNDPVAIRLIAEAMAKNNTLASAAASAKATRERVGITRAQILPTVGAALQAQSQVFPGQPFIDPNTGALREGQATSSREYTTGFSLSWEVDLWGRLLDQTRSAYLSAAAQHLDLASSQLSIAGSTAQTYYALTEAKLQRQLSERDVRTGQANLNIIQRRYDRGISSSLDLRLARSSLASSEATLIARQQTEAEAARGLEVLLGRYPQAEIQAADALPQLDALTPEKAVGNPLTLLETRPDILAAERRLKAAGLNARAAKKALIPSLSLSGFTGEAEQRLDLASFDISDAIQSLTTSLTQPLFQGGALRAQARAAKADTEAAVANYAQTTLTAFQEVENAFAAEEFLTAQLNARRLAFEEADAAEDLTNRQYLNGTTNIFNLISAQQRRIQAESAFISAKRARLTNRVDLYLALGAPFSVQPADDNQLGAANDTIREGDRP